jgi:Mg2+/citrate symporter
MLAAMIIGMICIMSAAGFVSVRDHRRIEKALKDGKLVIETVEKKRPNPVKDSAQNAIQVRLIRQD